MSTQATNNDDGAQQQHASAASMARGGSAVKSIAELLRGDNNSDSGSEGNPGEENSSTDNDEGDTGGESRGKSVPKDMDELAERLGVPVDELWKIEFTAGGKGRRMKFGELKDAAVSVADLEARELEFEESRIERENALLRERQELDWAIAQMPANDPRFAKVRERAAAAVKAARDGAQRAILEAIPEWKKDSALRERELDGMNAFIQGYGYSSGELDRILDPRLMKMLRDSYLRAERIKAALKESRGSKNARPASSETPPQQRTSSTSSSAKPTTAHQAAKQTRSRIGELLRNGR